MFTYGKDIPLDSVPEEAVEAAPNQPVEPSEFLFDYGLEIYPDLSD